MSFVADILWLDRMAMTHITMAKAAITLKPSASFSLILRLANQFKEGLQKIKKVLLIGPLGGNGWFPI